MITKTLQFVLGAQEFKILGAGRTDARVSSLGGAFELFLMDKPLEDIDLFIKDFNCNLPADIKILSVKQVHEKFNIIHSVLEKPIAICFPLEEKIIHSAPLSWPIIKKT